MAGLDAFGTAFQRENTPGGGVFTTIASVLSIGGPEREREAYDVTAHDSPDQYREFIPGLKDGGQVTLELNYDPGAATHTLIDTDFDDQTVKAYNIVIPGEGSEEWTWALQGFYTAVGDEFPHDGKMVRSVTLKVSGKPELTQTGT